MSAKIAEDLAANAALNDHQAPLDRNGEGDAATDDPMEEDAPAEDRNQNGSYAQAAANVKTLDVYLYREDKGSDFNPLREAGLRGHYFLSEDSLGDRWERAH